MAPEDIDRYLEGLDELRRGTLVEMRSRIHGLLPDVEEGISYQVPAFKVGGTTVAGLAAFKYHLSYLPHSGSVLPALADQLTGYTRTKSALHFALDEPLPLGLLEQLLRTRMSQAGLKWH